MNPGGFEANLASTDSSAIDVYSKWNELEKFSKAFATI